MKSIFQNLITELVTQGTIFISTATTTLAIIIILRVMGVIA